MSATQPVALLTDFGVQDGYVGMMKGVILTIAPGASIVDLSHDVAMGDVRAAAYILLVSYRFFPGGTVFCCVVDPEVGTRRHALAAELECGGRSCRVVCPDNGLLTPLLHRVTDVVRLADARYHLDKVSATFHGRDIFAPAAAHLARGERIAALGPALNRETLRTLPWPRPLRCDSGWRGEVIHVDRFGNLITNIGHEELTRPLNTYRVGCGGAEVHGIHRTFADVPDKELVAYLGSSDLLELAVRGGSAAKSLQAGVGHGVSVRWS